MYYSSSTRQQSESNTFVDPYCPTALDIVPVNNHQSCHGLKLPSLPHQQPPNEEIMPATAPHPHYPPHFMKGSIIQLADGTLKRVEDLQTDDFMHSADISADLKIDSSTVISMAPIEERGTALLGFAVGQQHVQARCFLFSPVNMLICTEESTICIILSVHCMCVFHNNLCIGQ